MSKQIERRRLDRFIIDLRIATNPHLKPEEAKKLITEFNEQRQSLYGYTENYEQLDRESLDELKKQLAKESQSISVK